MTLFEVISRPIVTEKGVIKKDTERTLCFEVFWVTTFDFSCQCCQRCSGPASSGKRCGLLL